VGVKVLCLAGPPRSAETSRPDSRDPVASGVKCGPHGGRKARRSRRSELVQGSGSQRKYARRVGGGSPQNRPGYLVEPQNQDRRLNGRRRDPGVPRRFEAEDTRRDRKACVEATQRAVAGHPSDGATKTYSQSALSGRVS
jgi:hypothetical protein